MVCSLLDNSYVLSKKYSFTSGCGAVSIFSKLLSFGTWSVPFPLRWVEKYSSVGICFWCK